MFLKLGSLDAFQLSNISLLGLDRKILLGCLEGSSELILLVSEGPLGIGVFPGVSGLHSGWMDLDEICQIKL